MSEQVRPDAVPSAGYQPTAAERAGNAKRRGQALIGAGAGALVIAVIVGVFIWTGNAGGEDPQAPLAAAPSAAAPAEPEQQQPTEAPSAPALPADLDPRLQAKPVVKAGSGALPKLVVTSLVKGTGPAVTKGQTITVNYVGVTYKDGKQFDSSWERGQPFQTPIGVGQVIPGWDQGLIGVPVGSRVQLDMPADLAYGESPQGGAPAGALRFVVDVLGAQ
jgi:peptidylprolyl isomerase